MGFKFERLDVWKKGIEYVDAMFEIADGLPQRYQFSLGEQLRRAAPSIVNNIAEGTGRDNSNEARYFFCIAKGSVSVDPDLRNQHPQVRLRSARRRASLLENWIY